MLLVVQGAVPDSSSHRASGTDLKPRAKKTKPYRVEPRSGLPTARVLWFPVPPSYGIPKILEAQCPNGSCFIILYGHKYRAPTIQPEWEAQLYNVIVAKCTVLESQVWAIGGVQDHIHLALSIHPPKHALASIVQQLKGNSSHFVNHVITPNYTFAWQTEYSVRSFGRKQLQWVIRYVLNQKQHHSSGTIFPELEPGCELMVSLRFTEARG